MTKFDVDYSFAEPQVGSTIIEADDIDEATDASYDYVRRTYPEAYDIEINSVEEVNG